MKTKNIAWIIVILILVFALSSCSTLTNKDDEDNKVFYGTAEADNINICSEIAGSINKISIQEGDKIGKNNVVAQLNIPEYLVKLQQSEIAVKIAENEFKRLEENSKNIDDRVLDNAEYALDQAKKNLELARLMVNKGTLCTPISATVEAINYAEGEYVMPGTPVLSVIDLSNLWVNIYIPERLLPRIHLNQEVKVSCDLIPETNIKGDIIKISSEAEFTPGNIVTKEDRTKLVYQVKVKLVDSIEDIRPGMLLEVNID